MQLDSVLQENINLVEALANAHVELVGLKQQRGEALRHVARDPAKDPKLVKAIDDKIADCTSRIATLSDAILIAQADERAEGIASARLWPLMISPR